MDDGKKQIVMAVNLIVNAAVMIDVTDVNHVLINVVGEPQLMRNYMADTTHNLTEDQKQVLLDGVILSIGEAAVEKLTKNVTGQDYRKANDADLSMWNTKVSA
jgi:hypothetical protein